MVSSENFLARALAFSVALHIAVFSGWKYGRDHGWWRPSSLPAWMQLAQKSFLSTVAKKNPPAPARQETPLLFIDVDPALADATPPKAPKFYSSANTTAANPDKTTPSDSPQISGTDKRVAKTVDNSKAGAKPLQPSPPSPEKNAAAEAKPKASETPGDLAMTKPVKTPEKDTGQADTQATASPQPLHERPRTIAEALKKLGTPGQKTLQNGGVNRLRLDSSVDAMRTSFGDYDAEMIDAIKERWFKLLENHQVNVPGKVVLEFRLTPDGRITNMQMTHNEAGEIAGLICQQAVLDPSPFRPWPMEMRREIGADFRDVRFTFYYDNP